MQYTIEVDEQLNNVLTSNAAKRNIPVPALIAEMLNRYALDAHIMEQTEMWKDGIQNCAEVNLDWANL